jgi:maltose alpha-D-glucosyltransferase / alpha-amylase
MVDEEFEDKVLLAEANQWPEDVVDYFGDGDECHMAFHFPVMPRMFMAVRREEAKPIVEILENTPEIPEQLPVGHLPAQPRRADPRDGHRRGARLHVREYARDPGCARTSASAAGSLPCSTTAATADRAVPRPAAVAAGQPRSCTTATRSGWATTSTSVTATASARRCSGAPTATPGSPAPTSPSCTCRSSWTRSTATPAINVEAQQRHPNSLLHWVRNLVHVRKQHPVFGTGRFEALESSNGKVLAFLREDDHDVLVVANLAASAQPVELDLAASPVARPSSCSAGTRFPDVGELPYLLTLGPPRLLLVRAGETRSEARGALHPERRRARSPRRCRPGCRAQRWFGGKARDVSGIEVADVLVVDGSPHPVCSWRSSTSPTPTAMRRYQLPLTVATPTRPVVEIAGVRLGDALRTHRPASRWRR